MMYKVLFSINVLNQFNELDKQITTMILKWIEKNLENSIDPCTYGKALTHNKKGVWRYRIGLYRLLCNINDDEVLIIMIEISNKN